MQSINDLFLFPVPEAEARQVLIGPDDDREWQEIWLDLGLLASSIYGLGRLYAAIYPSFTEFALRAASWYTGGPEVDDGTVRSLYCQVLLEQLTALPLHVIGETWCEGPPETEVHDLEFYGLHADLPWPRELTALAGVVIFTAQHRDGARKRFKEVANALEAELAVSYGRAGVDVCDWVDLRLDLERAARSAAKTPIDLLRHALLDMGANSRDVADWIAATSWKPCTAAAVRKGEERFIRRLRGAYREVANLLT